MRPGPDEVYHVSNVAVVDSLTPVERWRFRCFADVGFDPRSSERLARSCADVHQVLRAIKKGCSLELALDIFS